MEAIELQESAYPYHDWNERVTAECYSPNAASRILAGDNRITRIYQLSQRVYPIVGLEADELSQAWVEQFLALGDRLGVCVEPITLQAEVVESPS